MKAIDVTLYYGAELFLKTPFLFSSTILQNTQNLEKCATQNVKVTSGMILLQCIE